MSYATRQDLVDRFGELELIQLTDRLNKPPTTVDDTVVSRAIGDATALIDGYVGKVYALPLASVPPALTKVACDIARYYLYGARAEKDGPILRAHTEANSWLKDVSRGLVQLDVGGEPPAAAGGEPPAAAGGGSVRATPPNRIFSRDTLRGL